MRIANVNGRSTLLTERGGLDVEQASDRRFAADPQSVFADWPAFRAWAERVSAAGARPINAAELGPPVPRPSQVFAIGMNYRDHAAEAGLPIPSSPATFTKFPTCLTGANADVELPSGSVDWEVELVVVIGTLARHVAERDAWRHVAGLTVGQDLSERVVQWAAGGQFSLGKSFPGFGPIGPCIVTVDELSNPDDLELSCRVDDEAMQHSRTSQMVFSVPQLIAALSAVLPLLPGDIIFTGTPAGVGATRQPPRFLRPGELLTSSIEGIGTLRNRLVPSSAAR